MDIAERAFSIISKLMLCVVLLTAPLAPRAAAQSGTLIDPSRAVDWNNVGIPGGIPNRATLCATLNPGATASQISTALQNCPSGQVVFLNVGTYNLSTGIDFGAGKSNVTLRGAGADRTLIVFSGGGASCHGVSADICMEGSGTNWSGGPENSATWTATRYAKGQTQITMSNVSNLHVGTPLIFDQCNDGLSGADCTGSERDPGTIWVCDSVAAGCNDDGPDGGPSGSQRQGRDQQQIVTVTAINGNVVTFSPGLYMPNWRASQSPGAWWASGPISSNGVENLSMDHSASSAQAGTTILDCAGCWVKGVRSVDTPTRSHVWVLQSPRAVVRDSYFYGTKNAQSQSYGVEIFPSSDTLIENNIFQRVTAPQIVNGACSGCVISYNYSINDYETASPGYLYNSATLHAGGIDNVLFEGNVGASYRGDLFHGSHNMNTVFRNVFNGWESGKDNGLYPIFLNPFSRYFNVVGNVLGRSGIQTSYQTTPSSGSGTPIYLLGTGTVSVSLSGDPLTVSTLMRWGNYDTVTNSVKWDSSEVPSGLSQYANPVPADHNLPASLYLSIKPSWWPGSIPWPPIGPDVTSGNISGVAGHAYMIPAQVCYSSVMRGPADGTGNPLNFNADTCYGNSSGDVTPPSFPKNLRIR